jgi:hypothetical protein
MTPAHFMSVRLRYGRRRRPRNFRCAGGAAERSICRLIWFPEVVRQEASLEKYSDVISDTCDLATCNDRGSGAADAHGRACA